MSLPLPSTEEKDELLVSCRYGDLEDVQDFVSKFGHGPVNELRDANGNSVLHMVAANGHTGVYQRFPMLASV